MKALPSPNITQKELIHAYLEKERTEWLGACAVNLRANGANPHALYAEVKAMRMLDALLDEYVDMPGVRDE